MWNSSDKRCTERNPGVRRGVSVRGKFLKSLLNFQWYAAVRCYNVIVDSCHKACIHSLSFPAAGVMYIPYRVLCYNGLANLRFFFPPPIVINKDVGDTDLCETGKLC
jgi:hypothetical protein